MSVSAHIAEYQRIIMELRNQVAGLKSQLADRPTTIQEESSGRLSTLKEMTPSGNRSKQRTLDYVENLEKQHLQNAKNALLQAGPSPAPAPAPAPSPSSSPSSSPSTSSSPQQGGGRQPQGRQGL